MTFVIYVYGTEKTLETAKLPDLEVNMYATRLNYPVTERLSRGTATCKADPSLTVSVRMLT